jgi:nucleotide-binding universal stress UspA family protein
MFKRIAVAYNESAEAQRALASAIQLAKSMGAQLQTITVMAHLPSYTAFAGIADPSLPRILDEDRIKFYEALAKRARQSAQDEGIDVLTHSVEGLAVEEIVRFLREHKADLLIVGLHRQDLYVSRLWSTVFELAQEAPCSVLGVH